MIVAMSCLAAAIFASSVRPTTRGTISAASTPRIVMTTMISISVKPNERDGERWRERSIIRGIRALAKSEGNLKIRAERLEVSGFSTRTVGGATDIINAIPASEPSERGSHAGLMRQDEGAR